MVLVSLLYSSLSWGLSCDCEVYVYSPLTGSHALSPMILKTYPLEQYDSYKVSNQLLCRKTCTEEYVKDLSADKLTGLLISYSQRLISDKLLGYNCTGFTTIKYPIRVRATLGKLGLGNVADEIHVVTHEEICFTP